MNRRKAISNVLPLPGPSIASVSVLLQGENERFHAELEEGGGFALSEQAGTKLTTLKR